MPTSWPDDGPWGEWEDAAVLPGTGGSLLDVVLAAADGAAHPAEVTVRLAVLEPNAPEEGLPVSLFEWRFNETSGTVAYEEYGAQHGTYRGSPTLGVPGPRGDLGVALDGVDDWVEIPDSPLLQLDVVTVETWMRTTKMGTETGTQGEISYGRGSNPDSGNWTLYEPSGIGDNNATHDLQWVAKTEDGDTRGVDLPLGTIRDGGWHHVVGVFDGLQARLYVDGTLRVSSASFATAKALRKGVAPIRVGYDPFPDSGRSGYLQGAVALLRVYGYVLTDEEIADVYARGPV